MSALADPPPCPHAPGPDVAVPTPGLSAGLCSVCATPVPAFECAACGHLVPVVNLANRLDGTGCRGCGAVPGGQ